MSTLLGFSPFILVALLARTVPVAWALVAGAGVAAALAVWGRAARGRSLKILEVGSAVLFGGLAIVTFAAGLNWGAREIHLAVDLGMLAIVVFSLVARRPFTLQYAREETPREWWGAPEFLRANRVITTGWAFAFMIMVAADAALVARPEIPLWYGIAATVISIYGAIAFTRRYVRRVRSRR